MERGCLSEDELLLALGGDIASDSAEGRHLASCDTCKTVLSMVRSVGSMSSLRLSSAASSPGLDRPAASTPTERELQRGALVDRYLIVSRLGAGAMGVVYAAYDTELDRKIAVKLLHADGGEGSSSDAADRAARRAAVLAEAQAMARLTHPNVIRVYDVGAHDDSLFIAMELVEGGTTLAGWLEQEPRPWREVVARFAAAAQGLAAAHEAGVIHRDFKPANVLVRADGHVFVTDFGLARAHGEGKARSTIDRALPPPAAGLAHASIGGVIAGTPTYMAPEVMLGEAATAQSDQFSFAVSLYQGLFGKLPFEVGTLAELRDSLLAGVSEGRGSDVPRYVRRELAKALDPDPHLRHASMRALAAALTRGPTKVGARIALAALAVGAVVLGVVALGGEGEPDAKTLCARAGDDAAAVWSPEIEAKVRGAFEATKKPAAGRALEIVSGAIARWQKTYASMASDACVATRERTQPESLLARRASCLQKRRLEASALVDLFTQADGKLVDRVGEATDGLATLETCGDLTALSRIVALPEPGQAAAVDEARAKLAQAVALGLAGQDKKGSALAEEALATAKASGYRPLMAECELELGRSRLALGELDPAVTASRDAMYDAIAAQDDALAAKAAVTIVFVRGGNQSKFDEAREAQRFAEASIVRIGGDASLESSLANAAAETLIREGKLAEAAAGFRRALELRRKAGQSRWLAGAREVTVAENAIRNNLASALASLGQVEESLAEHRAVLRSRVETLGEKHPSVSGSYNNIGHALTERFRYHEALAAFEKSLALREETLPPEHPLTGMTHANVGIALAGLGRYEEALSHLARGLAMVEKKTGRAHTLVGGIEAESGDVLLAEGRLDEAAAAVERSFASFDASSGRGYMGAMRAFEVAGALALEHGDAGAALDAYAEALDVVTTTRPEAAAVVGPLVGLGQAHLLAGDVVEATRWLDEALAKSGDAPPAVEGDAAFAAARAAWMSGDDAGVAAFVARAEKAYGAAEKAGAWRAARLEAWLATR